MKKSLIGLFLVLNCVSIWYTFTKNRIDATVILNMPEASYKHWQHNGVLHCTLATNFKQKRDAIKIGDTVIGSVRNPYYEKNDKRDRSLLTNQQHVFVCSSHPSISGGSGFKRVHVAIPYHVLEKALHDRSLTIPYA